MVKIEPYEYESYDKVKEKYEEMYNQRPQLSIIWEIKYGEHDKSFEQLYQECINYINMIKRMYPSNIEEERILKYIAKYMKYREMKEEHNLIIFWPKEEIKEEIKQDEIERHNREEVEDFISKYKAKNPDKKL